MNIRMQEDKFGCVSYQDYKRYVDAVGELIEEYIADKANYEGHVLAINEDTLSFDLKDEGSLNEKEKGYNLVPLVRIEDNEEQPDLEAIEDVCNKYIFVR